MKNHLSGVNFIVTSYRMRPQDPVEVLAEAVSRSADTFHIFRDLLVLHVEVRTSFFVYLYCCSLGGAPGISHRGKFLMIEKSSGVS